MKQVFILLAISLLLTACLVGEGKQAAFNVNPDTSRVTVKWEYDKNTDDEIKGLRLYQAGGSLICATEDIHALKMECGIDNEVQPKTFKLSAYDTDGNETRYPATFVVN